MFIWTVLSPCRNFIYFLRSVRLIFQEEFEVFQTHLLSQDILNDRSNFIHFLLRLNFVCLVLPFQKCSSLQLCKNLPKKCWQLWINLFLLAKSIPKLIQIRVHSSQINLIQHICQSSASLRFIVLRIISLRLGIRCNSINRVKLLFIVDLCSQIWKLNAEISLCGLKQAHWFKSKP